MCYIPDLIDMHAQACMKGLFIIIYYLFIIIIFFFFHCLLSYGVQNTSTVLCRGGRRETLGKTLDYELKLELLSTLYVGEVKAERINKKTPTSFFGC